MSASMIRYVRRSLSIAAAVTALAAGAAVAGPRSGPDLSCVGSVENCVRGSGSFQVTAEDDGVRVTYTCEAVASTFATGTIIRPEAQEGCALRRGSATLDTAPGIGVPGAPLAVTGDTVPIEPGTGVLRVCWRVRATFSDGGNLEDSGCSPTVPSGAPPQIEDIAGDANGLNSAGVQLDTRPASYDPADLLTVRMETTYDAIPVGDDGIRHEPTGLAITIGTLATPRSFEDSLSLAYRLDTVIAGCRSYLEAATTSDGTVTYWDQIHGPPSACPNPNITTPTAISHPEWTATVDPADRTIRLHYPFSSLTAVQAQYLKVGNTLQRPSGATLLLRELAGWNSVTGRREAPQILDATATGPDFVIGSDVPPDIPCTTGCP